MTEPVSTTGQAAPGESDQPLLGTHGPSQVEMNPCRDPVFPRPSAHLILPQAVAGTICNAGGVQPVPYGPPRSEAPASLDGAPPVSRPANGLDEDPWEEDLWEEQDWEDPWEEQDWEEQEWEDPDWEPMDQDRDDGAVIILPPAPAQMPGGVPEVQPQTDPARASTDDWRRNAPFLIVRGDELAASGQADVEYLPVLGEEGFFVNAWTHVLAGYPKTGKTELMVRLVREWSEEKVLYLTEDPQGAWRSRIGRIEGPWRHVDFGFALGVGPAAVVQAIESRDATVVVVDTLRTILGLEDENDNGAVAKVLMPLLQVSRRKSVTLVFLHHTRKEGGAHGRAVAGAHSLIGAVDVVLELDRVENASNRRRLTGLARVIQVPNLLYEQQEDLTFKALGDPAAVEAEAMRARVLDVLDQEWTKTADVHERLSEPKPSSETSRKALISLLEDGLIERDPAESIPGKAYRWRRIASEPLPPPTPAPVGGEVVAGVHPEPDLPPPLSGVGGEVRRVCTASAAEWNAPSEEEQPEP